MNTLARHTSSLPQIMSRAALVLVAATALVSCASGNYEDYGNSTATINKVADFDHQVTGVTVSENNRIFVNFPRWTEDTPVSVAEVNSDGSITPYPDEDWNAWRNKNKLSPVDHFVSVQSVVADKKGNLWVVDPAAPNNEKIVKNGPKLVKIDLATNTVSKVYLFNENIAKQGSYLNDVRITNDGKYAFLTDSGLRGAIIVLNLETGEASRKLDGHPSTQVEKGVTIKVDGEELRRPDGRTPEFASDGIAITPDDYYLYWQALTGRTLYRIPVAALTNKHLTSAEVANEVEVVGKTGIADGLLINRQGKLFITSPEDDSVKIRVNNEDPRILVQDPRLRWPDTLAEGPDGAIYVTGSHIQDSPWFKPGADNQVDTELWKIEP